MEQSWNPPAVLKKYFPFEVATTEAIVHIANESGPFGSEPTLSIMKGPLVGLLHRTLSMHCVNSQCTLRDINDPDAYADINTETGEVIPRLVMNSGSPNSNVMFVGEGPGIGERNTYVPLVGTDEVLRSKCIECDKFEHCFRTIL